MAPPRGKRGQTPYCVHCCCKHREPCPSQEEIEQRADATRKTWTGNLPAARKGLDRHEDYAWQPPMIEAFIFSKGVGHDDC